MKCQCCDGSGVKWVKSLLDNDANFYDARVLMNNGLVFDLYEMTFGTLAFTHQCFPIAYETRCEPCKGQGELLIEKGAVALEA